MKKDYLSFAQLLPFLDASTVLAFEQFKAERQDASVERSFRRFYNDCERRVSLFGSFLAPHISACVQDIEQGIDVLLAVQTAA